MTFLERVKEHYRLIAGGAAVVLVALLIYTIIDSMPPRRFTILTAREGGAYYQAARAYQEIAAERGFELEIRTTSGSVETPICTIFLKLRPYHQ